MTYDDIRNMAYEAGLEVHRGVGVLLVRHPDGRWVDAKDELMAFANIAFAKGAAEERERILDMCGEGLWDGAGIRFHLEKKDRHES